MKIVKESKANEKYVTFNARLKDGTLKMVDKLAKANEVSRARLIEAIIEQVLADKSFELRI